MHCVRRHGVISKKSGGLDYTEGLNTSTCYSTNLFSTIHTSSTFTIAIVITISF